MSGNYKFTLSDTEEMEKTKELFLDLSKQSYFEAKFKQMYGFPYFSYKMATKRAPKTKSEIILKKYILNRVNESVLPRGSHKYHLI